MNQQLIELAERCEAATGPDRNLDGAIDRLFNKRPKHGDYDASENAMWRVNNGYSGLLERFDGFARDSFCAQEFTASLDAAMTLVPEGWDQRFENIDGSINWKLQRGSVVVSSNAATPALALTAAGLRARACDSGSDRHGEKPSGFEGEASQSGGSASERIAQTSQPSQSGNKGEGR